MFLLLHKISILFQACQFKKNVILNNKMLVDTK